MLTTSKTITFVVPKNHPIKEDLDKLRGSLSYGSVIIACLEYLQHYPELLNEIVNSCRNVPEVKQEPQATPEPLVEPVTQEENSLNDILLAMTTPA